MVSTSAVWVFVALMVAIPSALTVTVTNEEELRSCAGNETIPVCSIPAHTTITLTNGFLNGTHDLVIIGDVDSAIDLYGGGLMSNVSNNRSARFVNLEIRNGVSRYIGSPLINTEPGAHHHFENVTIKNLTCASTGCVGRLNGSTGVWKNVVVDGIKTASNEAAVMLMMDTDWRMEEVEIRNVRASKSQSSLFWLLTTKMVNGNNFTIAGNFKIVDSGVISLQATIQVVFYLTTTIPKFLAIAPFHRINSDPMNPSQFLTVNTNRTLIYGYTSTTVLAPNFNFQFGTLTMSRPQYSYYSTAAFVFIKGLGIVNITCGDVYLSTAGLFNTLAPVTATFGHVVLDGAGAIGGGGVDSGGIIAGSPFIMYFTSLAISGYTSGLYYYFSIVGSDGNVNVLPLTLTPRGARLTVTSGDLTIDNSTITGLVAWPYANLKTPGLLRVSGGRCTKLGSCGIQTATGSVYEFHANRIEVTDNIYPTYQVPGVYGGAAIGVQSGAKIFFNSTTHILFDSNLVLGKNTGAVRVFDGGNLTLSAGTNITFSNNQGLGGDGGALKLDNATSSIINLRRNPFVYFLNNTAKSGSALYGSPAHLSYLIANSAQVTLNNNTDIGDSGCLFNLTGNVCPTTTQVDTLLGSGNAANYSGDCFPMIGICDFDFVAPQDPVAPMEPFEEPSPLEAPVVEEAPVTTPTGSALSLLVSSSTVAALLVASVLLL